MCFFGRTGASAAAGGVPEGGHPVGAHRLLQQHDHLQPRAGHSLFISRYALHSFHIHGLLSL